jgi:hypothetical protein
LDEIHCTFLKCQRIHVNIPFTHTVHAIDSIVNR